MTGKYGILYLVGSQNIHVLMLGQKNKTLCHKKDSLTQSIIKEKKANCVIVTRAISSFCCWPHHLMVSADECAQQ